MNINESLTARREAARAKLAQLSVSDVVWADSEGEEGTTEVDLEVEGFRLRLEVMACVLGHSFSPSFLGRPSYYNVTEIELSNNILVN